MIFMKLFSYRSFMDMIGLALRKYPKSQPADILKLCYQYAFGASHFCGGEKEARSVLQTECTGLHASDDAPLLEWWGGGDGSDGCARLHLAPALDCGIPMDVLARAFTEDAARTVPDEAWFAQALQALHHMASHNPLPFPCTFTGEELSAFLAEYESKGCPALHHSRAYAEAYHPHYRVFAGPLCRLLPLITAACRRLSLLGDRERLCIAIDGCAASGKTTAAGQLARIFQAEVVHMDDFFLPSRLRTPERFAAPGGNVHYERFAEEVAPHTARREAFSYRVFDCSVMDYRSYVTIGASPVLIVEGSYALHPLCQASYSLTAFLDIEPSEQIRRIRERSGEILLERFRSEWIPMEHAYADAWNIRQQADFYISPSTACTQASTAVSS